MVSFSPLLNSAAESTSGINRIDTVTATKSRTTVFMGTSLKLSN